LIVAISKRWAQVPFAIAFTIQRFDTLSTSDPPKDGIAVANL